MRSIQTRARKEGDEWVIDGQKVFIGNGGIADVHVVIATVDPDAGHRGQGVFIVPKGTPGLQMLRKLDKLGCRASHTGELVFEDCRVPADQLLGGEERLAERIAKGKAAEQDSPPVESPPRRAARPRAVQTPKLGSPGSIRAYPPDGRRAGDRDRSGRTRVRARLRRLRARPSASRSSRTRGSPSRWPTSPLISTPLDC